MQIRKKWLNLLRNFLANISKNIICHLFTGESYQHIIGSCEGCIVDTQVEIPSQTAPTILLFCP
jgi:hypothetical protein